MLQAIKTHYVGPSNFRGARVVATADAGRVMLNWDHALNADANHCAAAQALALKYGWAGRYIAGGLGKGGEVVWVCDWRARTGEDAFGEPCEKWCKPTDAA